MLKLDVKSKTKVMMFFGMMVLFAGCAMVPNVGIQQETGTPVRTENLGKLIKGKTTKSEVIEWFGMPTATGTGSPGMPSMGGGAFPGAIITSGSDEIYIYKHCKIGEPGGGIKVVTVFSKQQSKREEKCEQLSVMFNKSEVVKGFAFHPEDPVGDTNVGKLAKGKSSKIDVIELFGAPSTISVSGNDEIYTFKKCITTVESGAFSGAKMGENCKQLTVMFDKNNEIVKAYSFQPYKQ